MLLAVFLQPVVDSPPLEHLSTAVKSSDSNHPLEFLGAEMANLQKLLATMRTGELTLLAACRNLVLFGAHLLLTFAVFSDFDKDSFNYIKVKKMCLLARYHEN